MKKNCNSRHKKARSLKFIVGGIFVIVFFFAIGIYSQFGLTSRGDETHQRPTHSAIDDTSSSVESVTSETTTVDDSIVQAQNEIQEESLLEDTNQEIAEPDENLTSNQSEVSPSQDINQEANNNSIIYLTFDDGPSDLTPYYLDILEKKNVNATFFIIDYEIGSEKEKTIIRSFNDGNTIGLHGTSHDYSYIYSSLDALINNYSTLQEKVYTSTGNMSYIIRFPGGSSNTVSKKYCEGIMTEAAEYFSNNNFIYFDWNVDSSDAGIAKTSEDVFKNVTESLRPDHSNVVLMHDSSTKQATLGALEDIIDFGLENGYTFKAITAETTQIKHGINN